MMIIAVSFVGAQETAPPAKLSMWNRGVFNFNITDGTTSVGPSWMGGGGGVYNMLALDWAWKDVSWTMTMQWDGDAWNNVVNLRDYSGNFSLFGGLARLSMGKVWSDGGYRFINFDTSGFSTRIAAGVPGVLLRLYPVKGLSIGGFLPVDIAAKAFNLSFADVNFGAEYLVNDLFVLRTSYRMEEDAGGNQEFAIGVGLLAVDYLQLTLGYRYLDVLQEHDIFLDTSYRFVNFVLRAFGDVNFRPSAFFFGAKINGEYEFFNTPFALGVWTSLGNNDAWFNTNINAGLYGRYGFAGGSSVQAGAETTYNGSSLSFKAQLQYTISF
jgi:hypothetical protein